MLCSLPFLLCSLLFTASLRPDTFVLHFFRWCLSVSLRHANCRKLQDSPFEQDPFAFHCKHSPVFRLDFFELVQYAISHTFSVCDNLVFLLLAKFLDWTVPQLFRDVPFSFTSTASQNKHAPLVSALHFHPALRRWPSRRSLPSHLRLFHVRKQLKSYKTARHHWDLGRYQGSSCRVHRWNSGSCKRCLAARKEA